MMLKFFENLKIVETEGLAEWYLIGTHKKPHLVPRGTALTSAE